VAVVGIVPAAGSGERLGASGPKAFVTCAGKPLLDWSLGALAEVCERVVVALPPEVDADGPDRIAGGASRSESVALALAAAPEAEIVVVHDAARPLVTAPTVRRCIEALDDGFDGAIAAARMTDTVKQAAADGRITATLDRSKLWRAQTPQVFRADVLRNALQVAPDVLAAATDDALLVEEGGGRVCVVEAPLENIKVTHPIDLVLAEALLRSR